MILTWAFEPLDDLTWYFHMTEELEQDFNISTEEISAEELDLMPKGVREVIFLRLHDVHKDVRTLFIELAKENVRLQEENIRLSGKTQLSGKSSKRQIDTRQSKKQIDIPKLWTVLSYCVAVSVISLFLFSNSEFIDFVFSPPKDPKQSSSSEVEITTSGEILEQETNYFCEANAGNPTAFARSDIGNIPMVEFNEDFNGTNALNRCKDFSQRLINFHLQKNIGHLTWMKTDGEDGRAIFISEHEGNVRSEENSEFLLAVHPDDQIAEILEGLSKILSSYEKKDVIKN